MEKRYIVVDETYNGDWDEKVYRTPEEANVAADMLWYHLTSKEKKSRHVHVIVVDESNLDPVEVEEYGLNDDRAWLTYSEGHIFPGAFDSENMEDRNHDQD